MKRVLIFTLVLVSASAAFAQPATPEQMAGVTPREDFATMHMRTKIGSFKIVDAQGRLDFSFKGTVLISQLKGTAVPSGNLKKEYDAHGRTVYFGTGRIVVTGSWRGIQWFGTDMNGVWYGAGLARLAGEFDKDLNTGEFWFSDPTRKEYWLTSGIMTVTLPSVLDKKRVVPTERGKGTPPPKSSGG